MNKIFKTVWNSVHRELQNPPHNDQLQAPLQMKEPLLPLKHRRSL